MCLCSLVCPDPTKMLKSPVTKSDQRMTKYLSSNSHPPQTSVSLTYFPSPANYYQLSETFSPRLSLHTVYYLFLLVLSFYLQPLHFWSWTFSVLAMSPTHIVSVINLHVHNSSPGLLEVCVLCRVLVLPFPCVLNTPSEGPCRVSKPALKVSKHQVSWLLLKLVLLSVPSTLFPLHGMRIAFSLPLCQFPSYTV